MAETCCFNVDPCPNSFENNRTNKVNVFGWIHSTVIYSSHLPFGTRRTWSVSPSGGRCRRVSSNEIRVQTSVIGKVYVKVVLVGCIISKVVISPHGTGHIRTASLPCALACERPNHWHKETSVNKYNNFIFIHSLDGNCKYLGAHLALVWEFFFVVHHLNVICKTLHFL